MSRRKAFDTSLSGGRGKAPQSNSSNNANPNAKGKGKSPATTPDSDNAVVAQRSTPTTIAAPPAELDDASQCFICAEPITYWAVGQCNHRVCHVCAIRLRVFYKVLECAYCKQMCPSLLFSKSPETEFPDGPFRKPTAPATIERAQAEASKPENKGKKWYSGLILPGTLDLKQFPYSDEKLGVAFEDEEVMEASLLLLRFNCPYPDCAHMANGWPALEKHTLAEHGLVFCKLCTRQLSRFSHEQVLYPPHLLALHDPSRLHRGQKPPRPRSEKEQELVKSWEAPHPMCEFCHEAFFGTDELFKHMRERHEECFVCKGLGQRDVYFQNYNKLETHFNRDHFPCKNPICIEKKFQVFGSPLDLQAHMMEEHGENMTARDKAQARHIPIDFSSRAESSSAARSGGRGFTLSGAQQLAAPPMDERQQAQQRRQIQTDRQEEGCRRKAFVTGLTDGSGGRDTSGSGSGRQSPQESASGFATPRDDVDDATVARHAALLARVGMLVGDSQTKLASFRSAVRQFKNNESSAKDMVDTVYHVLDEDVTATSGVVREIAKLFDGDDEREKQQAIIASLSNFRVEQEESFPALGGAPGGVGGNWAGVSSARILSAKRATHTGRGSANSRGIWDRVEAAAGSQPRATVGLNGRRVPGAGGDAFPSLGAAGPSKPAAHSTPWASGGAGSSSRAPPALVPQIRSVNYATGPVASRPKQINASSFPSLPSSQSAKNAAAERAALFSKPTARQESIARIRGTAAKPPPTNSWGGSGSATPTNAGGSSSSSAVNGATQAMDELSVDEPQPKSKKKGKQKQLLFSVSASGK